MSPATILIVDDSQMSRVSLKDFVVDLGHLPVFAIDGLSALAQMKKQAPDLVLLDIPMQNMDGYEVLEYMKSDSNLRHIPVIMITAVDEMDSIVRCIENGADDYLIRPFNMRLLKARINASLEKKRLYDQKEIYRRKIEGFNLKLIERVRGQVQDASLPQLDAALAIM